MIARIWHGRTLKSKSDDYIEYLKTTGIKDYERTEGNLGAFILRRDEGEVTHFYTLTFWASYEAIKKFAGEEFQRARYYPEDKEYLLEFEPTVTHYEVFDSASLLDKK
ncbi:MAG TPA: antibiotic biosynthesis monooxygenase [Bacteroidota bacterium]|nr:antibiotic biosynthesis monooxygenase [Bacteroidota bacterium]